jgi:di/tripeptidase
MAKLEPFTHLDTFKGKYAKSDKVYAKVRKFDNQMIGVRLKNPVTNEPPSAAQQTVQDKMKTIMAQVKTALADADQKATLEAEWKQQRKCKTLTGYVFRKFYKQSQTTNP